MSNTAQHLALFCYPPVMVMAVLCELPLSRVLSFLTETIQVFRGEKNCELLVFGNLRLHINSCFNLTPDRMPDI